MASAVRVARTSEERDLLSSAANGDVKRLISLLENGVFPNVHVCCELM